MILFLFSHYTRGQALLQLAERSMDSSANPFFTILATPDSLQHGDSITRVAHIYSGVKRVVSIQLTLTRRDTIYDQVVTASQVYDTTLVPSFPDRIDSVLLRNYRVTLVNSANINQEYPVELTRSYGRRAIKPLSSIKTDSLLPLPRGPLVSVSGMLVTTAQAANTSYPNQTVPQNYVRQSAEITAKIGGIPFTTSYLASTEGGLASNNINNLGFSIDFNSMRQALLKEIAAREQKQRDSILSHKGIPTQYEQDLLRHELLKQKIDSLKGRFANPEYRQQLSADSLAMLEVKDTGELDYRHKISRKRLETDSLDRSSLIDYQKTYDEFESLRKRKELVTSIQSEDLKLTKELDARKYNPLKKAAIKSVKRIDIGNFIPTYSELVLNGTNITGINLELNPGMIYAAGMAGRQKTTDPLMPGLTPRNISAAKLGAGRPDKFLLTFNILSGQVVNPVYTPENVKGSEESNLAAGLQLDYHYNSLFNTTIEYARSVSKYNGQSKPRLEETTDKANFGNAAYLGRVYGATPDNQTRYSASFRYVEPYFNSFGTPNLRKDNFRYELRVNQALVKNKITLGASYTHDNDNVSNTRVNTSSQNRLSLTLNIRYKKMPYVTVSYSPAVQKVQAVGGAMLYSSALHFVTISSGYNQKTRSGNSFTNGTYSLFTSRIKGSETTGVTVHQLMLANTTLFIKTNRSLKSSFTTYRYSTSDSISGMRFEAGLDKTNKSGSFGYEFGAAYQWDKNIETRYIIYTEVRAQLKYRISISARLEEHLLSRKNEGINDHAQQGRVIIIKTF
jgi:hypothetical protein